MSANDESKPQDVEKWLHDQVVPAHDRIKQDPNIALTSDEVRRRLDKKASEQQSPASPLVKSPAPRANDNGSPADGHESTSDEESGSALQPSESEIRDVDPVTKCGPDDTGTP